MKYWKSRIVAERIEIFTWGLYLVWQNWANDFLAISFWLTRAFKWLEKTVVASKVRGPLNAMARRISTHRGTQKSSHRGSSIWVF
jgi:hypothetical protein